METLRDYLRALLDRAAMPVATVLLWGRVTPNQVSLMGVLLTLVTAALIVDGRLRVAGFLYILAASLDLLDGALARLAKLASRFGAFLDSTADRISEGVVFAAIAYHFASRAVGRRRARGAGTARLGPGQLYPRPRRGPRARVQGRHHDPRRARPAGRLRPDARPVAEAIYLLAALTALLGHAADRARPPPAQSAGLGLKTQSCL